MPPKLAIARRPSIPWYRKLLFAVLTTIGLFAILEMLLWSFAVEPIGSRRDPFVGFDRSIQLFEPAGSDSSSSLLVTAPAKLPWFNEQSFTRAKPSGTRRAFCVGGSTTFGRPFTDSTSFCGWMRAFLPEVAPGQSWELINAGGVSYASYRVAELMAELVQYEPDLFIVYVAHNEFLERRTYASLLERPEWLIDLQMIASRTRTFSLFDTILQTARIDGDDDENEAFELLPAEVDERLNHTVGPADYHRDLDWEKAVLKHYEFNLLRMVELARSVGAEVIFVTPAAKLQGCAPFKSQASDSLTVEQQSRFDQAVTAAESAEQQGNTDEALKLWREAATIDPGHAGANFRTGSLLAELGEYDQSRRYLQAAIDQDICPLRATSEINQIFRRVAEDRNVQIVDFEAQLRALSMAEQGHDLLGEDYFLDHVHPTIDVNRQLGLWIIKQMEASGMLAEIAWDSKRVVGGLARRTENVIAAIDQRAQGTALRNLAKVLHWSGKFEEAAGSASDALELLRNDAESRLILADCLRCQGYPQRALAQFEILFEDYPNYSTGYLPFGELLLAVGQTARACQFLELAAAHQPEDNYVQLVLASALAELQESAGEY